MKRNFRAVLVFKTPVRSLFYLDNILHDGYYLPCTGNSGGKSNLRIGYLDTTYHSDQTKGHVCQGGRLYTGMK